MARRTKRPPRREDDSHAHEVKPDGANPARVLRSAMGPARLPCDGWDLSITPTRDEYLRLIDPTDHTVSSWKGGA